MAFLAHEGWRGLAARDVDFYPEDSDTSRDSVSSRDPYLQFAWDSTVPGEGELEMTNNALGIRSLSV